MRKGLGFFNCNNWYIIFINQYFCVPLLRMHVYPLKVTLPSLFWFLYGVPTTYVLAPTFIKIIVEGQSKFDGCDVYKLMFFAD